MTLTTLARHLRTTTLAAFSAVLLVMSPACGDSDGGASTCTMGELDCECAAGSQCGTGLVCNASNICEADASCTLGDTGCACTADGACTSSADECSNNVCGPRTSCDGELGCACDNGSCDAGLTCDNDVCTQGNAVLLTATGGDVRGCDLVINTTGRTVADVQFPAGYRGKMRTRDLKTSIAVIRTTDVAMDGVIASLVFDGDDAVSSGEAAVVSTTCYDRLGAVATGVTVSAN